MEDLTKLPNIGKILAEKLNRIGVTNNEKLIKLGSESALLKITTIENSGACINMLYALEGAIQGIRWHDLSKNRKYKLKQFYRLMNRDL